jgi:hypothetical protein
LRQGDGQRIQIDACHAIAFMHQTVPAQPVARIALCLGAKAQGIADVFLGNGEIPIAAF